MNARRYAKRTLHLAVLAATGTLTVAAGMAYAGTPAKGAQPVALGGQQSVAQDTTANESNASRPPDKQDNNKKSRKQNQPAATLGTIHVVGLRASVANAVQQERLSNNIVGIINAESISQFPATNVADALSRLPGVIITRNGGEGKNVSIRGLPSGLTLTELNGNFIANAQAEAGGLTRSFNYLLMPTDFIGSVTVYKSEQAKLDAGGIGGTVILHTRTPLDMPANKGFVQLGGTAVDTMGNKVEPRISALYSWHDKSDRFGVLVGIGYEKRDVRDYLAGATSWHWWANGTSASNYAAQPPVLVGIQ